MANTKMIKMFFERHLKEFLSIYYETHYGGKFDEETVRDSLKKKELYLYVDDCCDILRKEFVETLSDESLKLDREKVLEQLQYEDVNLVQRLLCEMLDNAKASEVVRMLEEFSTSVEQFLNTHLQLKIHQFISEWHVGGSYTMTETLVTELQKDATLRNYLEKSLNELTEKLVNSSHNKETKKLIKAIVNQYQQEDYIDVLLQRMLKKKEQA